MPKWKHIEAVLRIRERVNQEHSVDGAAVYLYFEETNIILYDKSSEVIFNYSATKPEY